MDKVTIIAELGINHDGDYSKALGMITEAQKAGVSIVKFQHYDPLKLLGPDSPYLEYATKCQFTKAQHERLKSFCDAIGMEYLVSVFDIADVVWADSLCRRHKVASRMNKDTDFLFKLLETDKQVIMSIQPEQGFPPFPNLDFMVCITEYPTSTEKINEAVKFMKSWVGAGAGKFGLSSHCPDIKPSLDAVAAGAQIIEHHVCFSRDEKGCDKSSSITFDELKQLNNWANHMEIV